jgi:hypothetical protein
MQKLDTFAKTYLVHIHLVAHSRKPDKGGEAQIPRRYNIMGSSYISNKPSNVIVVWRNRRKQDELEQIFQDCGTLWIKTHKGQAMPPWKRLMGGPPQADAPLFIKTSWNAMVQIVDELPKDECVRFKELVAQHDSYVIVDAQRGGDGDNPCRHLWFHFDSLQFLEAGAWTTSDDRAQPTVYVDRKATPNEHEPEPEAATTTDTELGEVVNGGPI